MEPRWNLHARRTGRLAVLFALSSAASGATNTIAHLPNTLINAATVDASGNIYLAGQSTPGAAAGAAYIAKLSSEGATTFYAVTLGGSGTGVSTATALALDSAGAVYVAGTTAATDFPVTKGAVQSSGATAFAAKLDAKGNILYSALIGGNAQTVPRSIVVNSKGELVVSGQSVSGGPTSAVSALFVLKLSADATQVVAGPPGVGGLVAADAQDNIAVAGVPLIGSNPPATPGAFQGVPTTFFCGCPFFNFPCGGNQFVASLTADLSQTRFLTYVTAKYGAAPSYLALDDQGNILIVGTTSAPAYPTTPGTYQPNYTAASGTQLTCGPPIAMEFTSPSGYVTLVKADGTGLIFSTFFSGSKGDSISFAALTAAGIFLAGQAGSVDLPGFDGAVPSPCVPVGFVTRIALDGSAISSSRTPPGTPVAYDSTTGTILLASGNDLLRFDPSQPTPIACLLDAADMSRPTAIAPGELLSVFGRFSYLAGDQFTASTNPVNGLFPTKSQGLGIVANQTPAPLLFVSGQQINFQAPYEIAGSPQANVTLTYADVSGNSVSDSRTLGVAATNPVAFLSQPSITDQAFPQALNANGTANSVSNPAAAGSLVTIFVDGLGLTSPSPVTGLVNTSPAVPLSVPLVVIPTCNGSFCYPAPTFASANPAPGSISGVTQVQLQAPANAHPGSVFLVMFSLSVGPVAVRDMNLSFWVK